MPPTTVRHVTFSAPVSNLPTTDSESHTSYLAKSAVELLPVRRILTNARTLRDSVILLHELSAKSSSERHIRETNLLLRIKHAAINFSMDFRGHRAVVPGGRFIGKIPSKHAISVDGSIFHPKERLMVFPYSTCLLLKSEMPCINCTAERENGIANREVYRQLPCLRNQRYGIDIDGGLQDLIRIASPGQAIVKIPRAVSLHDACFLFDTALPLLSFCVNVLLPELTRNPDGRILILLKDTKKEANDCLLVVRHLGLDPSIITFTDMSILGSRRDLRRKYSGKFKHVIVFDSSKEALDNAVLFGDGAFSGDTQHSEGTLCVFENINRLIAYPTDRAIYQYSLSFKDKMLFEELLQTLADLTKHDASVTGMPRRIDNCLRVNTTETDDSNLSSDLTHLDMAIPPDPELTQQKVSTVSSENPQSRDDNSPWKGSRSISWLNCDHDFRLCSDDNCGDTASARCHHTKDINKMITQQSSTKRVFYTHRSTCHVKLNAFVL